MSATIEDTVNDSPLFKHLDADWKRRLIQSASRRQFGAGDLIIDEGTRADALYIVVNGRVRVWTTSDDREIELKTLGDGAYFGEVSLLSGKDATASVTAKSPEMTAVALGRDSLLELVDEDQKVRRMLEGVTLARAKDTIGKILD